MYPPQPKQYKQVISTITNIYTDYFLLDEKFRHRSGWRGEARSVQLVMSVPFLLVMFDYWFRGEVGILFHSCAIFNPSILDKIMFPWPRTALESWVGAGGVD